MKNLKPMEALAALYAEGQEETSQTIVASLSRTIFEGGGLAAGKLAKKILARISLRVLQATTRSTKSVNAHGMEVTHYSNSILDRSGHGYARALMGSSSKENESLVEGGDPMNSQYMMMSPEIRENCATWDRIFLDSVQAKDVRLRMSWETQATYEEARHRLAGGGHVRLKAVAAGTGLSMLLVYDKLIRDGVDPHRITAVITDRDAAGIAKTNRLLDKLPTTKDRAALQIHGCGITAKVEDALASDAPGQYDVVTAIGILEYFSGHTYATTEEEKGLKPPVEEATAAELVRRLREMLKDDGSLVVNTYRRNSATQLLEIFGRRFDYRTRENLRALMASAHLKPTRLIGSGNIYDVEIYEKDSAGL